MTPAYYRFTHMKRLLASRDGDVTETRIHGCRQLIGRVDESATEGEQ